MVLGDFFQFEKGEIFAQSHSNSFALAEEFCSHHRYAVRGSNLPPPTKKATLLGGFAHGEGEIFAQGFALLALLQLQISSALAGA